MSNKSNPSLTLNNDLNQNLSLVEGTFSAEEAREILMALIQSKLKFHNLKNLRSFEQSGQADSKSENRIQELQEMREEVLELINHADKTDQQLQIDSKVNITLENNISDKQ
ncbi:hypothetical protein [Fodinibius salinus]|nr:hypothetical protein [Fodinibius salinus]